MPHICRIFRQNAAYFTAFLAGKLPAYFPKKSRYKPVSLTSGIQPLACRLHPACDGLLSGPQRPRENTKNMINKVLSSKTIHLLSYLLGFSTCFE